MEIEHLVQSLNSESTISPKSEKISEVLNQMILLGQRQLDTEETLMKNMSYPSFKNHKKQHDRFREKTFTFCISYYEKSNFSVSKLIHFLNKWDQNHTKHSDERLIAYLKESTRNWLPRSG